MTPYPVSSPSRDRLATRADQPSQFSRNNHFVPRSYLKRWAGKGGHLYLYRLLVAHQNVPEWKPTSTKGVAYHEHLYARALASGETDEVERWLDKEFETPAEGPIDRLIAGRRLRPDDWHRVIRFAAAQDIRTPARMLEILNRSATTLPEVLETTLKDAVQKLKEARESGRKLLPAASDAGRNFPARVTTAIEPHAEVGTLKVETVVGRKLWLFILDHLLRKTLNVLLKQRWSIIRPPSGTQWITSDDPVIKLNYYGPGKYDFRGGWGNPGTDIFLPLGPEHILFTTVGKRREKREWQAPVEMAKMLQTSMAEHAYRHIIAAAPQDWVKDVRPRHVDPGQYKQEKEEWRHWNAEQANAERSLLQK